MDINELVGNVENLFSLIRKQLEEFDSEHPITNDSVRGFIEEVDRDNILFSPDVRGVICFYGFDKIDVGMKINNKEELLKDNYRFRQGVRRFSDEGGFILRFDCGSDSLHLMFYIDENDVITEIDFDWS